MGGVAAAYLATLTVIGWRWFKAVGEAPPPVSLAGASVIYAGCAIAANADEKFGNTLAWGFFIGALVSPSVNSTTVGAIAGVPKTSPTPTAVVGNAVSGTSGQVTISPSTAAKYNWSNNAEMEGK